MDDQNWLNDIINKCIMLDSFVRKKTSDASNDI